MLVGPIDLTEQNPDTYNSSNLSQFAWTDDPAGTRGLLFVEFQSGSQYVYKDVPVSEFYRMENGSKPNSSPTSGEYFQRNIVDVYSTKDLNYNQFEEILD